MNSERWRQGWTSNKTLREETIESREAHEAVAHMTRPELLSLMKSVKQRLKQMHAAGQRQEVSHTAISQFELDEIKQAWRESYRGHNTRRRDLTIEALQRLYDACDNGVGHAFEDLRFPEAGFDKCVDIGDLNRIFKYLNQPYRVACLDFSRKIEDRRYVLKRAPR